MRLLGLGALFVLAACGSSSAQVSPSPTPAMVAGPVANLGGLGFDDTSGEMILLDPSGGGTWSWDGVHDWRHEAPSGPETKAIKMSSAPFGMAWDANTDSLIAEVGDMPMSLGGPQPPPATWSWRSGAWTRLEAAKTPPVMGGAIAAFPPGHQLIMFGGCCGTSGMHITAKPGMWAWDGTTWTDLHPPHMPPARWGQSMAFDAALGKVVMYGGMSMEPDTFALNDTWAWDGSDWAQLGSPPFPAGYAYVQMTNSPDGSLLLTALGNDTDQPRVGSMWSWTLRGWLPLNHVAPRCGFCTLGYDPRRKVVVMVASPQGSPGTMNQVWTWNGVRWSERS